MENNERVKINIMSKDGVEKEATVLLYFRLTEFEKDYVVYTYGETDANGLETLYTSTVVDTEDGRVFDKIESDKEWKKIKEVMKSVIKANRN